jgi:hypothetical protein
MAARSSIDLLMSPPIRPAHRSLLHDLGTVGRHAPHEIDDLGIRKAVTQTAEATVT